MNQKTAIETETKPRFFYGYIIVILCFLILLVSFGIMDSFGVFIKPLTSDFAWSRWMISASYSLSFLIFGFVGIVMGGLTDRYGPRVILTCCGLFLGVGYLLMSQLMALWQLYLFQGVIIGVGMRAHAGVAMKMFQTLAAESINIKMISTSEIKVSCVIEEKYTELAVRVLHKAFGLDSDAKIEV